MRKRKMIKLRLEGKEEEIKKCIEKFKNDEFYEVLNISRLYTNRNEQCIYSRCYIEVEMKDED